MDKLTLIRTQAENKKLHDKLDLQDEKLDRREEEARVREKRLNDRIEELTQINRKSHEAQILLMDQLVELNRQLKQIGNQYNALLVELKRQRDLNKQAHKNKNVTTS